MNPKTSIGIAMDSINAGDMVTVWNHQFDYATLKFSAAMHQMANAIDQARISAGNLNMAIVMGTQKKERHDMVMPHEMI